jgi:hypothetical protein
MLAEVAAAYRQGRRLFVVTTNLDAQRVVFNIQKPGLPYLADSPQKTSSDRNCRRWLPVPENHWARTIMLVKVLLPAQHDYQ